MATTIRLARPGDIPALIDLASETFIDSFGDYHTPENCQAFIAQSHNENIYRAAITNDDEYVLIAEGESGLVSYLYAKPPTLPLTPTFDKAHELSKIYTMRSTQSAGIGAKLLKMWEGWALANGYSNLVLGVWSENISAQKFYIRHGYTKISSYQLAVGQTQDTDFIFHKAQ